MRHRQRTPAIGEEGETLEPRSLRDRALDEAKRGPGRRVPEAETPAAAIRRQDARAVHRKRHCLHVGDRKCRERAIGFLCVEQTGVAVEVGRVHPRATGGDVPEIADGRPMRDPASLARLPGVHDPLVEHAVEGEQRAPSVGRERHGRPRGNAGFVARDFAASLEVEHANRTRGFVVRVGAGRDRRGGPRQDPCPVGREREQVDPRGQARERRGGSLPSSPPAPPRPDRRPRRGAFRPGTAPSAPCARRERRNARWLGRSSRPSRRTGSPARPPPR